MRGEESFPRFTLIFHVQVGIYEEKKQIHVRKEGLLPHVQVLKVIEAQHPSSYQDEGAPME